MTSLEKRFVNSPGHSRNIARLFEQRLRHIPEVAPGMSYLDVGCGNGAAARQIARSFGLDVTGVDADPEQIVLAKAKAGGAGRVCFREADATRLPFEGESFHIVATNKVTHHIAAWPRAIAEMARVLVRGGYLVYGDFVFPEWLAPLARRAVPDGGYPTVGGLEAAAEMAGLAPIHWKRAPFTLEVVWWKPGPPVIG
ncbi:MAG: class I SAM-dependent methyltransferase [Bryobacteraceae bacterium]